MASAMSHAIHKIVSKNAANLISYRGIRRITAKVKTVICEQAPNHGSYFAYARLIARVTLNLVLKAMDGGRDASAAVDKSITGEGVHRHDGRVA